MRQPSGRAGTGQASRTPPEKEARRRALFRGMPQRWGGVPGQPTSAEEGKDVTERDWGVSKQGGPGKVDAEGRWGRKPGESYGLPMDSLWTPYGLPMEQQAGNKAAGPGWRAGGRGRVRRLKGVEEGCRRFSAGADLGAGTRGARKKAVRWSRGRFRNSA